jgi:ABC-type sugar transport system substrate-binding protein
MQRTIIFLAIGLIGLWTSNADAQQNQITVGISLPNATNLYYIEVEKEIKLEAARLGDVQLVTVDAASSAPKQTSDIGSFLARGVNSILVVPINTNDLTPTLQEALKRTVPIVLIGGGGYDPGGLFANVEVDDTLGGASLGRAALSDNSGNVNLIYFRSDTMRAGNIAKGLQATLDRFKDRIRVVYEGPPTAAARLLSINPSSTDVILCDNDEIAIEARNALGSTDTKTKIYGYGASPEARASVTRGALSGTVELFPGQQGRIALDLAISMARDHKRPQDATVLVRPIAIGMDNIHQVYNEDVAGPSCGPCGKQKCCKGVCSDTCMRVSDKFSAP